MSVDQRSKHRTGRIRGEILRVLYSSRPRATRLDDLRILLDRASWPCSDEKLAQELEFLLKSDLLEIGNSGKKDLGSLSQDDQQRLLAKFALLSTEGGDVLPIASLTAEGILVAEGSKEILGIELGM